MRVLISLSDPPIPMGSAAARWYYVLLQRLEAKGFALDVLVSHSSDKDVAIARNLFPAINMEFFPPARGGGIRGKWLSFRQPFSYTYSPSYQRAFSSLVEKEPDVVHLEQLWSGWLENVPPTKTLMNVHHLPSIDLASVKHRLSDRLMRHLAISAEKRILGRLKNFRTLTPRLAEQIRNARPAAEVAVVPLGIDSTVYPFTVRPPRTETPIVTLIGSMGWYPTYSAAVRLLDRLWPKIKQSLPAAKVRIVGRSACTVLRKYLDRPGVVVVEDVEDIFPYFRDADVLLYAPSRGSGMKVKVLEAMCLGLPVVTTSEGIEGLPAIDGVHAGIADDDQGLIDRCLEVLRSQHGAAKLRRNGRRLIEEHCNPQATADAIVSIYERIVAKNGN